MAKQITSGEQWALLLVPTALIFGLTWVAGRNKARADAKGLGDCGCGCKGAPGGCGGSTSGLGMVEASEWYGRGDDYQPYEPALAARQHMIKPMPSQG